MQFERRQQKRNKILAKQTLELLKNSLPPDTPRHQITPVPPPRSTNVDRVDGYDGLDGLTRGSLTPA